MVLTTYLKGVPVKPVSANSALHAHMQYCELLPAGESIVEAVHLYAYAMSTQSTQECTANGRRAYQKRSLPQEQRT